MTGAISEHPTSVAALFSDGPANKAGHTLSDEREVAAEAPVLESGISELALSSQHTSSCAELLEQIGISIAVRTYPAGKPLLLRAQGGEFSSDQPDHHVRNASACGSFNRKPQACAFPSDQAGSHIRNTRACGVRLNERSQHG